MSVHFSREALAQWSGGTWQGRAGSTGVCGVVHDSRTVSPGCLYVALKGQRVDGHDFVETAFAQGASAALVDAAYAASTTTTNPLLVVPDPLTALRNIAHGHRTRCGARIVGVTGSVGKTTVKEMTADLLAASGAGVARTWGNWNNDIGLPFSLLTLQPDDRYGVFEIGMNHPGELRPLCALLRPEVGIITPIGPVHLEFFPDVAAIAKEKATLLEALPKDGLAVLCVDDPWYAQLREHVGCRLVRVSAREATADYTGEWQPEQNRMCVREQRTGESHYYPLPLPGEYVVGNVLRAVATGRELGVSPGAIQTALANYRPPAMRWNSVRRGDIEFINDAYNANPVSMRAAIDALQTGVDPGRRKWVVLAGMYELGPTAEQEHEALGRAVAAYPWAGVITVGARGAWIARGVAAACAENDVPCYEEADTRAAARRLRAHVQPGDCVLLKASRSERLETVLSHFEKTPE